MDALGLEKDKLTRAEGALECAQVSILNLENEINELKYGLKQARDRSTAASKSSTDKSDELKGLRVSIDYLFKEVVETDVSVETS
jgi:hypothetical protein